MRIEIWSDIVCPWCFIGKRRLETAVSAFRADHPEAEVEVVWHSFQLDPAAPAQPEGHLAEHLGRKYGGGADAGQQMIDRMEAAAAEEGLLYRLGQAQPTSTVDAHRLLHLALEPGQRPGLQDELKEALLTAYLMEGRNVADHDTLTQIATGLGLDGARVTEVLTTLEYADAVEADIREAAGFGATGVPFFVIDRRYGVTGAQPAAAFTDIFERLWAESHPVLDMVGGAAGEACGPDGCAI